MNVRKIVLSAKLPWTNELQWIQTKPRQLVSTKMKFDIVLMNPSGPVRKCSDKLGHSTVAPVQSDTFLRYQGSQPRTSGCFMTCSTSSCSSWRPTKWSVHIKGRLMISQSKTNKQWKRRYSPPPAAELKKLAILAIQDWGTLWESGEHFFQKTMHFFLLQILRYVTIYALLRPFSDLMWGTF